MEELFYTKDTFFRFLRQTPRLIVFGEGTDMMIADFAQMNPETSRFWVNYCEVLEEILDENDHYEDEDTPVLNLPMTIDIEMRLAWRLWSAPRWLSSWFNRALEDYGGYPQFLTEDKFPRYYNIEWEQTMLLYYFKFHGQ